MIRFFSPARRMMETPLLHELQRAFDRPPLTFQMGVPSQDAEGGGNDGDTDLR